ncbi:MAG: hypothetical protein JSS83_01440 [Cyanobacteria bacterium SZAS LIN-3]|nr:hypothetical protein [Cyanobacteria bacterium SZAS LIN-3]
MPATTLENEKDRQSPAPAPEASAQRRGKRALAALVQALAYLAFCLLALEGFFYLAAVGDGEHVMPDIKVGYKIFPNKRITQRNEGFGCFKLNSFGMQNDEITVAKPAGVYRIAVFGDSYVEALQVPREANYPSLLARDLSAKLGREVQVLNFGVSNYSVAQDYLRYQTLAKQFKPDMVIQVFRVEEIGKLLPMETQSLLFVRPVLFPGPNNDVVYDNTCVRQFFAGKEGRRLLATQWLRANSRIWGVLSHMWQEALTFQSETQAKAQALTGSKKSGPSFSLPTDQTRSNYAKCYWYMMDRQLSCFQKECAAEGTSFMFLRTPMVRPGMHELTDNETETTLLEKTAANLHVPVLNLDRAYRAWAGTRDDGTNFSSGGHFTRPLHQWVAARLSDFLTSPQSPITTTASAKPKKDHP